MFSVPHYSKALNAIREEKGIAGEFNTNLIEVRQDTKSAIFEITTGRGRRLRRNLDCYMLRRLWVLLIRSRTRRLLMRLDGSLLIRGHYNIRNMRMSSL